MLIQAMLYWELTFDLYSDNLCLSSLHKIYLTILVKSNMIVCGDFVTMFFCNEISFFVNFRFQLSHQTLNMMDSISSLVFFSNLFITLSSKFKQWDLRIGFVQCDVDLFLLFFRLIERRKVKTKVPIEERYVIIQMCQITDR